jgi:2TM domain
MVERVYTKEEADAILARAIELQGHAGATSHPELVATAREIGVAPEALEMAAAEVLARRRDDQALRTLRARRWRGFFAHLVPYVCVGMLLGFINVITGGFPWAVIPMLGWGIGIASHLLAVAMPDEEKLKRRLARQRERDVESQRAASLTMSAQEQRQDPSGGRLRVEAGGAGGLGGEAHGEDAHGEAEMEVEEALAETGPSGASAGRPKSDRY